MRKPVEFPVRLDLDAVEQLRAAAVGIRGIVRVESIRGLCLLIPVGDAN